MGSPGTVPAREVDRGAAAELPPNQAKIQPGEELRSVDGVPVGPHVNLDSLLEHKVDKRVMLDINGREVAVRPTGSIAEQLYRDWVEQNRAYVAKSAAAVSATSTCATCPRRR